MNRSEWKEALQKMRAEARDTGSERDLTLQILEGMSEDLDLQLSRIVQLEERYQALARRVETLESRIHEEVE